MDELDEFFADLLAVDLDAPADPLAGAVVVDLTPEEYVAEFGRPFEKGGRTFGKKSTAEASTSATNDPAQSPMPQALEGSSPLPENALDWAAPVYKGCSLLSPPIPITKPTKAEKDRQKRRAKAKVRAQREAVVHARRFRHARKITSNAIGLDYEVERRSVPRWRDLDEEGVAQAIGDFLAGQGECFAFSLELDEEIRAQALAAPSFSAFIRDAIDRRLRRAFGRKILFVIVAEAMAGAAFRPHLHGVVVVSRADLALAEKALTAAGGEHWRPKRKGDRQFAWSVEEGTRCPRIPDHGWLAYAVKEASKSRRRLKGSIMAGSREITSGARAHFKEWRNNEIAKSSSVPVPSEPVSMRPTAASSITSGRRSSSAAKPSTSRLSRPRLSRSRRGCSWWRRLERTRRASPEQEAHPPPQPRRRSS